MEQARVAQIWVTWVFVAALALQFFFAGAGAFGATGWALHEGYGYVLTVASIVVAGVAVAARRLIPLSTAVAALTVVQLVLAMVGDDLAWLGALHGLNSLFVFGLALMVALRAQRVRIALGGEASPGPEPRA
jgi:hypothetical protein